MEVQLEEEYEDKQKVLRDRRELECKLLNTQDQVPPSLCFWSLLVLSLVLIGKYLRGVTGFETRVLCHLGEPEGREHREEAEERSEENQSPSC